MKTEKKAPPSHLELLGGKKEAEKGKGEKKKVHGLHIKRLKGGYHVQHHDENGAPVQGEEHLVPDTDALHDHLEEHLGEPNQDEEAAAAPGATT